MSFVLPGFVSSGAQVLCAVYPRRVLSNCANASTNSTVMDIDLDTDMNTSSGPTNKGKGKGKQIQIDEPSDNLPWQVQKRPNDISDVL